MRAVIFVMALVGLFVGNGAWAQDGGNACGPYPRGAASYSCSCPPMSEAYGVVWGTEVFTSDSNVCMAALHSGAIGIDGGDVTAMAVPGQESYLGSMSNGVPSRNWGAYDASFMFDMLGPDPVAVSINYDNLPECTAFPTKAESYSCFCTPQATTKGPVWGNDPYTADSSICRAALHSGLIAAEGGAVTALRVIGLDYYGAVDFNGVQSEQSDYYDGSFVFDRN